MNPGGTPAREMRKNQQRRWRRGWRGSRRARQAWGLGPWGAKGETAFRRVVNFWKRELQPVLLRGQGDVD